MSDVDTPLDRGEMTTASDDSFRQEALFSKVPVLVFFGASWCSWCRRFDPIVRSAAKSFAGRVKCVKIDLDTSKVTAAHYEIKGVPVVVMFNGGKEIGRNVGFVKEPALIAAIEKAISTP